MDFRALPNFRLSAASASSRGFLRRGLDDFHRAARHVWLLPYGRNLPRADWRRVLPESRGTCSTKHALLAAVAAEHGAPVQLVMGLYEMSGANTPGVGPVLARHGLEAVLEAHCYLRYVGERVDLTRAVEPGEPLRFVHEEVIEPHQIGAYKQAVRLRLLWDWAERRGLNPIMSVRACEECIAALEDTAP